MYKAAVIGDYDSIYGFAALGLDTFPTTSAEQASVTLRKIASGSHAVIYITEALAAELREELDAYRFIVWAPNARRVSLVGEFNGWDVRTHRMEKVDPSGVYEVFVEGLHDYQSYKFHFRNARGEWVD